MNFQLLNLSEVVFKIQNGNFISTNDTDGLFPLVIGEMHSFYFIKILSKRFWNFNAIPAKCALEHHQLTLAADEQIVRLVSKYKHYVPWNLEFSQLFFLETVLHPLCFFFLPTYVPEDGDAASHTHTKTLIINFYDFGCQFQLIGFGGLLCLLARLSFWWFF